jgi:hypothetical protein
MLDLFLREKLSKKAYNLHLILAILAVFWHMYGMFDNSGIVGYLNNLQADLFSERYYPVLSFALAVLFCNILA